MRLRCPLVLVGFLLVAFGSGSNSRDLFFTCEGALVILGLTVGARVGADTIGSTVIGARAGATTGVTVGDTVDVTASFLSHSLKIQRITKIRNDAFNLSIGVDKNRYLATR